MAWEAYIHILPKSIYLYLFNLIYLSIYLSFYQSIPGEVRYPGAGLGCVPDVEAGPRAKLLPGQRVDRQWLARPPANKQLIDKEPYNKQQINKQYFTSILREDKQPVKQGTAVNETAS